MLDLIDDDEWFELGLTLASTVARLPQGSQLIEAVRIPPFRLAVSAAATPMPMVVTRVCPAGLRTDVDAVDAALSIASDERRDRPGALTIALTQTLDGEHFAIAVLGLPGEARSWTTFGLAAGSHNIDVGYIALERLEGWALRHDRPLTAKAAA